MAESLDGKHWAILDVQNIKISPRHRCVRRLYLATKNGAEIEMEFCPCKPYRDILLKYRRSFQFCKNHIHNLTYTPWGISAPCEISRLKLEELVATHGIDLILYKGGSLEAELCKKLNIDCKNLETMDIEKSYSLNPRQEIDFYYNQLINI